jgi:PIN domain nuclease of toxin-antitoxin system
MRILLDTHVWLWLQAAPERIAAPALQVLADPEHTLLLSSVSAAEIAIKHSTGKLTLPLPPQAYVLSRMELQGVEPLAFEHDHALRLADLPMHHRDPFDRMLIAQAQLEAVTVATADAAFAAYGVSLLDC